MSEDNPYRLHTGLQSNAALRRPGSILKTGLGGMGVGMMWIAGDDTEPQYDGVPYECADYDEGDVWRAFIGQPHRPVPDSRATNNE